MTALRQKIALFFLSLFILITVISQLPTPARAQCPTPRPASDDAYCTAAELACAAAPILRLFGGDSNLCLATVFDVGKAVFSPPPPAPWYDPSLQGFAQKVFDPANASEIFGERYTYAQVNWIINSLIVFFFPPIRAHDAQELFTYLADIIQWINNFRYLLEERTHLYASINLLPKYGFVGQTYYIMAQIPRLIFTDKIASGVDEVKYVASKFSLSSPAYAQGLGYDKLGLGTIRSLWIASRNLAYLISTIILIAAGFMVIFRTRISPQVSVTVQMIIPRLVISLVLVTFSYAIAGFVIDLMYVLIAAVIGFIYFSQSAVNLSIINNLGDAVNSMTGNFNFVWHFLGIYIIISILLLVVTVALLIIAASAPTFTWSIIIGPIAGFIMGFFMWSVYVWARIIGQLIVAYLTLILLVIAGPILIIFDILPTSHGGFKKWLSCVAGQVSVFTSYSLLAILCSMLFLPDVFTQPFTGFNAGVAGNPILGIGNSPFINSQFSLPGFSMGSSGGLLGFFIFIGFMSAVPNIVNGVKNMFCKSADYGDFFEKTVKDTIGQITTAGQNAASAVKDKQSADLRKLQKENAEADKLARTSGTSATQ